MSRVEKKKNQNDESSILKIVRQFNVAPDIVFDAFTDPEAMRVWWTDETTFDFDLRVDGQWKIVRTEGEMIFTMLGEFLEVDRPHRLRYTIAMPQFSPNNDMITIDIASTEDGCEMTFVQSGKDIAAELQDLEPGSISESEKGWQQGFDMMAEAWEK